jgi:hypothetical protein
MRLDPSIIRQQIGNLLVQFPELAEDEQLRADSIEGETEAFEFLALIIRQIEDARILADGTAERIKELNERGDRFARRIEAFRSLAFKIMEAADLTKAELPCATLSIRKGGTKIIITDESAIPDILCKFSRAPDRTKIKELLTDGKTVIGAELSNAEPSLSIRIK